MYVVLHSCLGFSFSLFNLAVSEVCILRPTYFSLVISLFSFECRLVYSLKGVDGFKDYFIKIVVLMSFFKTKI